MSLTIRPTHDNKPASCVYLAILGADENSAIRPRTHSGLSRRLFTSSFLSIHRSWTPPLLASIAATVLLSFLGRRGSWRRSQRAPLLSKPTRCALLSLSSSLADEGHAEASIRAPLSPSRGGWRRGGVRRPYLLPKPANGAEEEIGALLPLPRLPMSRLCSLLPSAESLSPGGTPRTKYWRIATVP